MELLFTSYKGKDLKTDVYKLAGQELLGKHRRRDGTVVEFIVDDSPNMREVLRGEVHAILHVARDYAGGVNKDTFVMRVNNAPLTRIAYMEYYGTTPKSVFMRERGTPLDYRKSNLTLDRTDMVRSQEVIENRKKVVARTLLVNQIEYAHKRMNAEFSGKVSAGVSAAQRDRSTFTLEDVAEIREMALHGAKQQELADMYGTARTTIADILYYRTWNVHEFIAEDIEPVDVTTLPHVPYLIYQDEPTKLRVDGDYQMFYCDGFIYKFQQKVDVQVYLSKHLPTGELVADVHVTFTDKPRGANRYRNYVISYMRGNRLANYYMSKEDVYSVMQSYMSYLK